MPFMGGHYLADGIRAVNGQSVLPGEALPVDFD